MDEPSFSVGVNSPTSRQQQVAFRVATTQGLCLATDIQATDIAAAQSAGHTERIAVHMSALSAMTDCPASRLQRQYHVQVRGVPAVTSHLKTHPLHELLLSVDVVISLPSFGLSLPSIPYPLSILVQISACQVQFEIMEEGIPCMTNYCIIA